MEEQLECMCLELVLKIPAKGMTRAILNHSGGTEHRRISGHQYVQVSHGYIPGCISSCYMYHNNEDLIKIPINPAGDM